MDFQDNLALETVNTGSLYGDIVIYQYKGQIFHEKCLASNSIVEDSTGLRLHAGAIVGIHFLANYLLSIPQVFSSGCSVCELGCGTGIFGLLGTKLGFSISRLVLTDGNSEAAQIAKLNMENWSKSSKFTLSTCKFHFESLLWGDVDKIRNILRDINLNNKFDLVMGSELMYYRTDMSELNTCVKSLVKEDGLFLHVHILRRHGQGSEIVNGFKNIGWDTIEVDKSTFISLSDMAAHPEWSSVRCLISGSYKRIADLFATYPEWKVFVEEDKVEEAEFNIFPLNFECS